MSVLAFIFLLALHFKCQFLRKLIEFTGQCSDKVYSCKVLCDDHILVFQPGNRNKMGSHEDLRGYKAISEDVVCGPYLFSIFYDDYRKPYAE